MRDAGLLRGGGSAVQTELGLARQQALLDQHQRARELRKEGRVALEIGHAADVVQSTVTNAAAMLGPAVDRVEVDRTASADFLRLQQVRTRDCLQGKPNPTQNRHEEIC